MIQENNLKEKNQLYAIINESIENDLNKINDIKYYQNVKMFLKLNNFNTYSLIELNNENVDYSVKCIFNEQNLKKFFDNAPNYITFNSFNSNIYIYLS